jgi:omega-amidase
MRVIGCQIDIAWEDKAENHRRVLRQLRHLNSTEPVAGALVVLAEMFSTGFSMNVAGITDSESRATQQFLSETAKEFGIYLLGGVVTTDAGGEGRNECVLYSPAGVELARYCKIRRFTIGGEADNYVAGTDPVIVELQGIKVAPFICYDLRFPELFRAATRLGAQAFTVIASWPQPRIQHWIRLLEARAIENQAYIIGVNRCGSDPMHKYTGDSMIVDPRGQVLAHAGPEPGIISADWNLDYLLEYRRTFPFLDDMLPQS